MTVYTLTLIEASGIQDYIFGSNNLAVNLGASELVDRVTRDWLFEALPRPHNLIWAGTLEPEFAPGLNIIDQSLAAEVIYRGGGNALILFATRELALAFTQKLSLEVLTKAPGLQIVIEHCSFDWVSETLRERFQQTLRPALAQRKLDHKFSTPLPGLSVTAACVFTGQPAAYLEKIKEEELSETLFSDEVRKKLDAEEDGKERLHQLLPQVRSKGFEFVYNFDHFGTHGTSSYIALIHTDGNKMGDRIDSHLAPFDKPKENPDAVQALREFSESVKSVAMTALQKTLDSLLDRIQKNEKGEWVFQGYHGEELKLPMVGYKYKKPAIFFRPIVFGGDDVTFITDGRIGLALASVYLQASHAQLLADKQPAYARAGVAVVKSHYPFSRAYDLSESLTSTVKKMKGYPEVVALDWHFAVTGLIENLEDLRLREYMTTNGSLLMRPIQLDLVPGNWQNWPTFTKLVSEFKYKPSWADQRNKMKALREALRGGPEKVKQFMLYHPKSDILPLIDDFPELAKTGWFKEIVINPKTGEENEKFTCVYYDAIEATDFFIPLIKEKENE